MRSYSKSTCEPNRVILLAKRISKVLVDDAIRMTGDDQDWVDMQEISVPIRRYEPVPMIQCIWQDSRVPCEVEVVFRAYIITLHQMQVVQWMKKWRSGAVVPAPRGPQRRRR